MFKGSIVALVTPMHPDGKIDKKSLHDLVEWHIASKTDGIVVVGTTGEPATLSAEEQFDMIATVAKQVAKRIPVIAGTGTFSTKTTYEATQRAKDAGADACLIITPYCTKPSQNGLYEHYKYVAENTSLPIILYNVPGRTACDLLPETVERLAKIKNIVGIKEATGKIDRAVAIRKTCPANFCILSGDDATAFDLMLQGANGVISVVANAAPREMHDLCQYAVTNNQTEGTKLNQKLMPLHTKFFLEANPIPVKWALYEMGKIPAGIRLPLTPLDAKYRDELKQALQSAGLV